MGSQYLNKLGSEERRKLEEKLLEIQRNKCFICEDIIDLGIHPVQIDHVIPLKMNGNDDPSNFALAHSSCNQSKQDSDLRIARILAKFNKIQRSCLKENRGANLNDILNQYGWSKYPLNI